MSRREIKLSTTEGEMQHFLEVIFWAINHVKLWDIYSRG